MERNPCNETQAAWYLITRSVVVSFAITDLQQL
jgi:hypothetical protein